MHQEFHAIYEHGVLRPLAPLNLPESTQVSGTLRTAGEDVNASVDDEVQRQQQALDAMFAEVEKLPQVARNDGLSGRDHDQIIYGSAK